VRHDRAGQRDEREPAQIRCPVRLAQTRHTLPPLTLEEHVGAFVDRQTGLYA